MYFLEYLFNKHALLVSLFFISFLFVPFMVVYHLKIQKISGFKKIIFCVEGFLILTIVGIRDISIDYQAEKIIGQINGEKEERETEEIFFPLEYKTPQDIFEEQPKIVQERIVKKLKLKAEFSKYIANKE